MSLVMVVLVVLAIGTVFISVGFGSDLWRAFYKFVGEIVQCTRSPQPSTIQPLWLRLRAVTFLAAWLCCVSYGLIVLFWWNRASMPEVLAYAVGCAFAFVVTTKIRSAEAPPSAVRLAILAVIVLGCAAGYTWGLYSGISRGWSDSGYFVAYRNCNSTFDRCIESGPYRTIADCGRELIRINGHYGSNDCIELRDVPRAYLPWSW
jgi:hypothetical protein